MATSDKELYLHLTGPDSGHASADDIEFLGRLMAAVLYHEIDTAAEMLLRLSAHDRHTIMTIMEGCGKLSRLCQIVAERGFVPMPTPPDLVDYPTPYYNKKTAFHPFT